MDKIILTILFFKLKTRNNPNAMVWMFESPENVHAEILTPEEMVLGSGALGMWLDHEGGATYMESIPL
jgi:hypothetical protein